MPTSDLKLWKNCCMIMLNRHWHRGRWNIKNGILTLVVWYKLINPCNIFRNQKQCIQVRSHSFSKEPKKITCSCCHASKQGNKFKIINLSYREWTAVWFQKWQMEAHFPFTFLTRGFVKSNIIFWRKTCFNAKRRFFVISKIYSSKTKAEAKEK